MPRQPSAPGAVPNARIVIDDARLDLYIDMADSAAAEDGSLTEFGAFLLLEAVPLLLRELQGHRRLAGLNTITPRAPVNLPGKPQLALVTT
ncbi:MAG: hypothetical protein AAFY65_01235 [Pseudomonadota bacterium]